MHSWLTRNTEIKIVEEDSGSKLLYGGDKALFREQRLVRVLINPISPLSGEFCFAICSPFLVSFLSMLVNTGNKWLLLSKD